MGEAFVQCSLEWDRICSTNTSRLSTNQASIGDIRWASTVGQLASPRIIETCATKLIETSWSDSIDTPYPITLSPLLNGFTHRLPSHHKYSDTNEARVERLVTQQ